MKKKRRKKKLKHERLQQIQEKQRIRRKRRLAKGRHNYDIEKHVSHANIVFKKGGKVRESLLKK